MSMDDVTLDPSCPSEWDEARRAGHELVERVLRRIRDLPNAPCWQAPPPEALGALGQSVPREGLGIEQALAIAARAIEPYGTGNLNPRFWGWVIGAGNVAGMYGSWLASAMNANLFAGNQGPVHLELQVIEWFRSWLGFPSGSSGLLVDGGSMGNLLGLAVARHWATGGAVKTEGPEACRGLRIYGSVATHSSVVKAAQLLGLGTSSVRLLPTLPDGSADVTLLEAAIKADRRLGLRPFCVIGSAGTVGIGAIDPLERLRALADDHRLWFHVDGAIGALGWLAPPLRPRLAGMDTAHSLSFDLHKWGQVPYDAACLLVRDGTLHRAAFQEEATYLRALHGGLTPAHAHAFHSYSPLLSKVDRALKIWMTFMALGTDRIAAVFIRSTEQARWLATRVESHPDLELCAPVALNIVCLRYRGGVRDAGPLDDINRGILVALQDSGFCVMSPYELDGRFVLRVCLSNHRTRRADLEALVAEVASVGRQLSRRAAAAAR
jgi:glutamate/tyrosine decarboxylase-like PLP-dependent enzyme